MDNKDYKYIHYASYMHSSNGTGVMEIYSCWSKIDTRTKLADIERIIKKGKKFDSLTVTGILTVRNK